MLSSAFMMLLSSAFLMLRLGTNTGSFPKPLNAEEERLYVDRWLAGDIEARNKLIEHNLRLVAHIIKKYYTQTSDQDDLISIGTIGLIKGISTYRPDKGVRLATYASKCVENEILMYFRGMKKTAGDLSLSESIDVDGDGNSLSLMDIISQDDDMLENISTQETFRNLRRYVDTELTPREAEIVKMRYGLEGAPPRTQREVAQSCGISRSYVSRIEKKALEKLRTAFED
jgi:RNA polymerase sporulation-specific sigma factor